MQGLGQERLAPSFKQDVSAGGSYALFAGKECARALGKMTMDAKDCTAEVSDLSEAQLKTLSDWEEKFQKKYDQVGMVR